MAPISFPFTLTAGTPENVNQLNANLNAIIAQFNGNIELAQLAPAVQALLVPNVPAEFQAPVLDVGLAGQLRAGRELTAADFTTLCGLPTTPVGLFNLTGLTNLGSGGALVNKGVVTFNTGINGIASTAAQFTGSTGQALYIADTGASDPFRLKVGSWGCWMKTAKRGTVQFLMAKCGVAGTNADSAYLLRVDGTTNAALTFVTDGTSGTSVIGATDICDDRWHWVVASHDGTVTRLYVDGVLDGSVANAFAIQGLAKPFNIGGEGADAGTAAVSPHFGRVDEAFVTPDVLSDDQIRLLYCAKIVHGFASAPTSASLLIRRRKRGGDLITTDFPSQPVRLYNFAAGALTDAGTGNVALTNNNTCLAVAGADGQKDGAFNYVTASSQTLSSTDAGLPTTTRSYGLWFKTANTNTQGIMGWGTVAGNLYCALWSGAGSLTLRSGATDVGGPFIADSLWHFAVVVEDNTATEKLKLYVDGRVVASSVTAPTTITLAGANALRIGSFPNATSFFLGQADAAFIHSVALTAEQVATLYAKGSQALPVSVKEPGSHIEAFDVTNIYATFDTLESTSQIDLKVAL